MASLSDEVAGVLRDTGDLLATLVEGSSAPSPRTDAALPSFFTQFDSISQRWRENRTTVAVLALAKSGQSLLGGTGASAVATEWLGTCPGFCSQHMVGCIRWHTLQCMVVCPATATAALLLASCCVTVPR